MSTVHRGISACVVAAVSFALASCSEATRPPEALDARFTHGDVQGNGAPSGSHFNLNLIGVDRGHENDISPNSHGHRIFVKLWGKCDIDLTEGDYQVLDWSCLDGDNAAFQLPDPADSDSDGKLQYSVWVRALGKPSGEASMVTCFTDLGDNGGTFCNAGTLEVSLKRTTGPHGPKFVDVSKELLQVCADTDDDGSADELVPLFDDAGEDYFWHYDNQGLRLAQMRFYPVQTTDQGGACDDTQRGPHPAH